MNKAPIGTITDIAAITDTSINVYEGEVTENFRTCWFDVCKGRIDLLEELLGIKLQPTDKYSVWVCYKIVNPKLHLFAKIKHGI